MFKKCLGSDLEKIMTLVVTNWSYSEGDVILREKGLTKTDDSALNILLDKLRTMASIDEK